ncbi:unnamed protein product [Caenorhabditis auriculariae]|uniref:Uncharacterized protein n=1 Tax=Caenorhabditis auriculariae TaxID=2777116 RepID=A0A8S1HIU5_9PELO|nr:unnamed protein product [Caenorhabditis auriculariae]
MVGFQPGAISFQSPVFSPMSGYTKFSFLVLLVCHTQASPYRIGDEKKTEDGRDRLLRVQPPKPQVPVESISHEKVDKFFAERPSDDEMNAYSREVENSRVGSINLDQKSVESNEEEEKELLLWLGRVYLQDLANQITEEEDSYEKEQDIKSKINVENSFHVENNINAIKVLPHPMSLHQEIVDNGLSAPSSIPLDTINSTKTVYLNVDLTEAVLLIGIVAALIYTFRKASCMISKSRAQPAPQMTTLPAGLCVPTISEKIKTDQ